MRFLRTAFLVVLVATTPACRRSARCSPSVHAAVAKDWGHLPRTNEEVRAKVDAETTRPRDPDAMGAFALASKTELVVTSLGQAIGGQHAIVRALDAALDADPARDGVLLVGTSHGAPAHAEAFRALVGPGGLRLTHVGVEQFEGAGGWDDVEAESGDDPAIARYLATGSEEAYRDLAALDESHDYTAWKFGYQRTILGLVVDARADRVPLFGCDLPRAIYPPAVDGVELLGLRELHCAHALRRAIAGSPGPHRVAVMWGEDHVLEGAFPRFLDPRTTTLVRVRAAGCRASDALADPYQPAVAFVDPLLVPLTLFTPPSPENLFGLLHPTPDFALVLPCSDWTIERARTTASGAGPKRIVGSVVDQGHGNAWLVAPHRPASEGGILRGGRLIGATELTELPADVPVDPGASVFVMVAGGAFVVGALEMPAGGHVDIEADVPRKTIRVTQVENAP